MSVTIIKAHERKTKEGKSFVVLELMGDAEFIQSQTTGKFYLTSKRTTVPSTFDLAIAQSLVGQKMPGSIIRVQSNPYDYTIPSTGEVVKLAHTYAYTPEEQVSIQNNQSMVSQFVHVN